MEMVKDRESKKTSIGSGKHKWYACSKVGHFARDKICPARGKTCAQCGDKEHWAACCKSEAESKNSGQEGGRVRGGRAWGDKQRHSRDAKRDPKSRNKQVNQVEYDSGDEALHSLSILMGRQPVRIT